MKCDYNYQHIDIFYAGKCNRCGLPTEMWGKTKDGEKPMSNQDLLPFAKWSQERIAQNRKFATSRSKRYSDDPRVMWITVMPLEIVRDYLWQVEGADSPEEFEKVWRSIHRGHYNGEDEVFVHFGDFRGKT